MKARSAPEGRSASQALAAAIEEARLNLVRLKDERAEIETRPVSEADAIDRLDGWCRTMRAAALARFDVGRFTAPNYRDPLPRDVSDFTIGFLAGDLRETLADEVRKTYAVGDGIDDEDRRAAIVRVDGAILAQEFAEEGLIRQAEVDGFAILRRADADPRAVLASDGGVR